MACSFAGARNLLTPYPCEVLNVAGCLWLLRHNKISYGSIIASFRSSKLTLRCSKTSRASILGLLHWSFLLTLLLLSLIRLAEEEKIHHDIPLLAGRHSPPHLQDHAGQQVVQDANRVLALHYMWVMLERATPAYWSTATMQGFPKIFQVSPLKASITMLASIFFESL